MLTEMGFLNRNFLRPGSGQTGRSLRDFRSRTIRILVATDVMSRGIDVKEINLVIIMTYPMMLKIMFIGSEELPGSRERGSYHSGTHKEMYRLRR